MGEQEAGLLVPVPSAPTKPDAISKKAFEFHQRNVSPQWALWNPERRGGGDASRASIEEHFVIGRPIWEQRRDDDGSVPVLNKKIKTRLRELASAARGSQGAGSCNLVSSI